MKKNKKKLKKISNFFEASLAYFFYYILSFLPAKLSSKLGYFLGKNLIPIFAKNRKTEAVKNILLAFPSKTEKEATEIFAKSCGVFVANIFEIAKIKKNFLKRFTILDKNNLLQSIKNKKSLVFTAHYGCWEAIPYAFDDITDKCYTVYKKPSNVYLAKFFLNMRSKMKNMKMISLDKKRLISLNNEVKNNNVNIVMLVDQKIKEGLKVKFFNRPAYTSTFLPLFALKYDMPLIPARVVRKPNFKFDVIVEEPIFINKTNDKNQDIQNLTTAMNEKIEEWIKKDPTQWFWLHKRW